VTSEVATSAPLRALLAGAIDYAGLFPPATLQMADAVRNYAVYADSADRWALGRFVLPVARLDEFEDVAGDLVELPPERPWPLSAVFGAEIEDDAASVAAFNERLATRFVIDAIEARAAEPNDIRRIADAVPRRTRRFAELPTGADLDASLRVAQQTGTLAKLRTGGVIAGAFPSASDVITFLEACHRAGVPFKATAGLHHPVRGSYRLTYESEAPSSVMFGYLNIFLAAAVIHGGGSAADAETVVTADEHQRLRINDAGIRWAGVSISTSDIATARAEFITSFGSCSFREPIDELAKLSEA
jgi:hypothetical protein